MLAFLVNACLGALDPLRGHRPYSCSSRPEDLGWVPAHPTSGTAIEFQFLSLFVTVSFLKVRARPDARKEASIRSLSTSGLRVAVSCELRPARFLNLQYGNGW